MTDHTIEISVKGKWIKVPALRVEGKSLITKGKWLKTAIVEAEEWLETETRNPAQCVESLKQAPRALRADIFTFTQKVPDVTPKHEYHTEWDSIAAVRTSDFKGWWESLPQETRKNVRRAQKRGVVITVKGLDDELLAGLIELNNDSPVRQGKAYTHYGKTLEEVRKDQESFPEQRELVWAHAGTELVGFLKIIYRGQTASVLQLIPKASQSDKRPANALIAKAVELCEARGITHLVFGMFSYGNKRGDSLQEFKIRNGFEEMLMPRFYVPLTVKGRLCMKLGLHRGLIGILPGRVLILASRVRAVGYNLKKFISRCSSIAEQSNRNRQTERANPPTGSTTSDTAA